MRRPFALAVLPALALTLTACSDDPPENPTGVTQSEGAAVDCPPEAGAEEPVQSFSAAPPMCIDPEKSYTAVLKTDAGEITVALDAKRAPKTVNNFVFLARYGFYEGVAFHRVIPTFVIQSGSPSDDPNGGPGYQFEDELPEAGEYELGSVAMANRGPDTNGSQFFIVSGEQGVRGLSPDYSLFGQVTEGMDVVAAIEEDGSGSGLPEQTHTIDEVTITEE